jgi:glucose-6-phosphate 1-dehydrogenase
MPCVVTIFGATGDLTHRKLIPALYDLAVQKLLPDQFVILGYGRRPQDEDKFRDHLGTGIKEFARLGWHEETWNWLKERIFYQQGAYDEAASFKVLEKRLSEFDKSHGTCGNRLYYLATPPGEFAPIIEHLGSPHHHNGQGSWRRIIVEKPFGRDLGSRTS